MEDVMGYENCGKHPNSLKSLRPLTDSDKARELQAKGAEKRRQNKIIRESMALSAAEFKKIKEDILPDLPDAVTILKVQLAKAMANDDAETIERLSLALAEYERPKLQRIDQTNINVDQSEVPEDEIDRRIKELEARLKS